MVSREPKNKTEISIHALREEGDTKLVEPLDHPEKFLSTPSARRATLINVILHRRAQISIHALREEGDKSIPGNGLPYQNFYPRPPRGGRPRHRRRSCPTDIFLSTPSARRATLKSDKVTYANTDFYPRPPRGGRRRCTGQLWPGSYFYPRPPRGGRRRPALPDSRKSYFYPRPPRGGRRGPWRVPQGAPDFYPRPPRGGRLTVFDVLGDKEEFLSTPSARRATRVRVGRHRAKEFLSTPSARRATRPDRPGKLVHRISIHALREEGDKGPGQKRRSVLDFYPRPPRGGRRPSKKLKFKERTISIHALREEGDRRLLRLGCLGRYFYPRPPRGGRLHGHLLF